METQAGIYLGVELKSNYFDEFIVCGIPIPPYIKGSKLVLKFDNCQAYLNYCNVLKTILHELQLADPDNCKYEIQRSSAFIKNILSIIRDQFYKRYN